MSGSIGCDRHPVAPTTKRAVTRSPVAVVTVQVLSASSNTAATISVPSSMSRRRSRRSHTKLR